jgi:hypothetical protein
VKQHLAHDPCHELDRGAQQRCVQEECRQQTLVGAWQKAIPVSAFKRSAACERNGDASKCDADGRAGDLAHLREVCFHTSNSRIPHREIASIIAARD